ncbi:MAG: CHASE2 domain-containing protein [Acidobacteria bacterium]|nr:CHASE2 domain-containing protein [Acidobacteriota bacterium]
MPRRLDIPVPYLAVLAAAAMVALAVSFTPLAESIDRYAYDWLFRLHPEAAGPTQSVVLAVDEQTLALTGGMPRIRATLADALEKAALAHPAAVAIDITLPDAQDKDIDARLERVFSRTPNLILPIELMPAGDGWQEPLPRFAKHARATGHVYADPDPVNRRVPMEKAAKQKRFWALSFEAWRIAAGGPKVVELPDALEVVMEGGQSRLIPAARETARAVRVRYQRPPGAPPVIPLIEVTRDPNIHLKLAGKILFVGVTAQSAARDRLMTPLDSMMMGVEIHAQTFETLARGVFLRDAPPWTVAAVCLVLAVLNGVIFHFLAGWRAYVAAGVLLAAAHATPHAAFLNDVVFPYFATVSAAWLSAAGAAAYQYFTVRAELGRTRRDKDRYRQAIHFVTHEMRTPLTAIQGSSELMGRYNLNEEKRREMARMINAESKRLAGMIQTFLDVERLSEGQIDLKREPFSSTAVIEACAARALPLAEQKKIRLSYGTMEEAVLLGDRELMEYAVYNLLTNAVKYSPAETEVTVAAKRDNGGLRLSVTDQGIGMDEKELKSIFTKFYRTSKAEASGVAGTGIGLSIVEQIVQVHRGSITVASTPGAGSCFTVVLPVHEAAA